MLTLKTNDNEDFQVEESIATQSKTIKNMVEDNCASSVIPLPNVSSKTLTKVIEYLKTHENSSADEKDLKEFDKSFMDFVDFNDRGMLIDLVTAAYYLDISGLQDVSCQKVVDTVKDMSVEDVRDFFGVENDYTPEQEQKIRSDYHWAFE